MLNVRVDDFPSAQPLKEAHRHNIDSFKRFHEVMEKHVAGKYVLGVIPEHTTDEHLKWFSEHPSIEVAMHGVWHDEQRYDEFDGYTVAAISEAIEFAVHRLRAGTFSFIRSYVPPHNAISPPTILALKINGFDRIFVGPGCNDVLPHVIRQHGLNCVETWGPHDYGRSDEMLERGSDRMLRERLNNGEEVWVTLHFPWECNIGFEYLDTFLTSVLQR